MSKGIKIVEGLGLISILFFLFGIAFPEQVSSSVAYLLMMSCFWIYICGYNLVVIEVKDSRKLSKWGTCLFVIIYMLQIALPLAYYSLGRKWSFLPSDFVISVFSIGLIVMECLYLFLFQKEEEKYITQVEEKDGEKNLKTIKALDSIKLIINQVFYKEKTKLTLPEKNNLSSFLFFLIFQICILLNILFFRINRSIIWITVCLIIMIPILVIINYGKYKEGGFSSLKFAFDMATCISAYVFCFWLYVTYHTALSVFAFIYLVGPFLLTYNNIKNVYELGKVKK